MINREITYERSVSRSYMKIPACLEASFDEEMMLKKEIPGFLQVEKCYINGVGQYWYNITGKQALDSYTKMKNVGLSFVKKLLLNICSQMEKLEWNLIGMKCLVLEPELIYIANGSEEIYFTLYPENKGEVYTELTKLMEYLLTRLDHSDTEAVKTAYTIYELTLTEGYSLSDIRAAIEKNEKKPQAPKEQEPKKRVVPEEKTIEKPAVTPIRQKKKESCFKLLNSKLENYKSENLKTENMKSENYKSGNVKLENYIEKIRELWNKAQELLKKEVKLKTKMKEEVPFMVYPKISEDQESEVEKEENPPQRMPVMNPTICLVSATGKPRGILMHEGLGDYPDYELSEKKCEIGNNVKADLYIRKDTISCFHAGIEYCEGNYYIEDLNSTNGTYINDVAVNYKQKQKLVSGDEIRFADVRYRFL